MVFDNLVIEENHMKTYEYPDFCEEEIKNFCAEDALDSCYISSREEAMEVLVEQLFDSLNDIDPEEIYNAIIFLLHDLKMKELFNEIGEMDSEMLCIVHEKKVAKAVDEALTYQKLRVKEVLEN